MTDNEHHRLFQQLTDMIATDFGPANEHGMETPFRAHCIAHHGLFLIQECYKDLEIDQFADSILNGHTH